MDQAICQATLNNDPDTLQAILIWAQEKKIHLDRDRKENKDYNNLNPLLIAIQENYQLCANILYKHGFEVKIHEEDQRSIDKMIETDDSFGGSIVQYQFNKLCKQFSSNGPSDVEKVIHKRKSRLKKFSKHHRGKLDPVERLLRFQAFSSPLYISLEFQMLGEKSGLSQTGRHDNCEKDLKQLNPLRKAFACANYSKTPIIGQILGEMAPFNISCQTYIT